MGRCGSFWAACPSRGVATGCTICCPAKSRSRSCPTLSPHALAPPTGPQIYPSGGLWSHLLQLPVCPVPGRPHLAGLCQLKGAQRPGLLRLRLLAMPACSPAAMLWGCLISFSTRLPPCFCLCLTMPDRPALCCTCGHAGPSGAGSHQQGGRRAAAPPPAAARRRQGGAQHGGRPAVAIQPYRGNKQ